MIGIYKITKKENGKSYIGQSNDINRRFQEHKNKVDIPVEIAIQKYGSDAFTFEIIEECELKELDNREIYWIAYYNTYKGIGYNCNPGGGNNRGENNGRTKLTNEDVAYIRECYDAHMRRREVYQQFKNKISFDGFASIWDGSTWKDIKIEVYTKENKDFYKYRATNGENSDKAKFTNEEVIILRERYVNEEAHNIYEDYKDRCNYQTLQQILWGRTYKDLPIYKKKQKIWVNK
jgi:group I intron endonuclease